MGRGLQKPQTSTADAVDVPALVCDDLFCRRRNDVLIIARKW